MSVYRSSSASLSSLGALVRRDSKPPSPKVTAPPPRTINDIRNQVAHEVAMRAIATGKIHQGSTSHPRPMIIYIHVIGAQVYGREYASPFPNHPTTDSCAPSAPSSKKTCSSKTTSSSSAPRADHKTRLLRSSSAGRPTSRLTARVC